MLERLSRTKRNLALGALAVAMLWFFWTVRSVLNPLILGYLLAYIVHPVVLKLERRGWRRRKAVNFIYLGGGVTLTLMMLVILFQGISLAGYISTKNKGMIDNVESKIQEFLDEQTWISSWVFDAEQEEPGSSPDKVAGEPETTAGTGPASGQSTMPAAASSDPESGQQGSANEQLQDVYDAGHPDKISVAAQDAEELNFKDYVRALWEKISTEEEGGSLALQSGRTVRAMVQGWFGSLIALVTLLILTPIYAYFLLFELGRIHGFVRRYIPKRERERMSNVSRQIGEVLANFFRGRLTVCLIKGILLSVGLGLVGVKYALLLGMSSGFLALIPFAGPVIGFAFAFVVALLDKDTGLVRALLATGVIFTIGEVVEGYVLVPKILGDSLGLHPVVVLVSVFVGGAALGMFGFLIALPLTACIVILVRELVLPALADFADEDAVDEQPPESTSVVES